MECLGQVDFGVSLKLVGMISEVTLLTILSLVIESWISRMRD